MILPLWFSVGMQALWDDYASSSEARRRLLESRYGQHKLQSTVTEALSEEWVVNNSKYCPHCYFRIQKNGGCNIMTCSLCRQLFCWACLTRLSTRGAGEHFRDSTCSHYNYSPDYS
ncbi:hypothetical protein LDENG_00263200 [Lucifuga dentata]|nr:hypothetical protein LDENG_00263200 [Lucifuga dentata]